MHISSIFFQYTGISQNQKSIESNEPYSAVQVGFEVRVFLLE